MRKGVPSLKSWRKLTAVTQVQRVLALNHFNIGRAIADLGTQPKQCRPTTNRWRFGRSWTRPIPQASTRRTG